jgi:hypothetical protein
MKIALVPYRERDVLPLSRPVGERYRECIAVHCDRVKIVTGLTYWSLKWTSNLLSVRYKLKLYLCVCVCVCVCTELNSEDAMEWK